MPGTSTLRLLGTTALGAALVAGAVPAAARPLVEQHIVSAPSSAPADAIARSYLATRPALLRGVAPADLELVATRPLSRGATVHYAQAFQGLPVIGGRVTVRVDAAGRVRWAAGQGSPIPADFDVTPSVTARRALELAGAGGADPASQSRLVIWAPRPGEAPRLAWQVLVPADWLRMQAWRVLVDARTGEVIFAENRAMHANKEANVFEFNPTKTPTSKTVSLAPWMTPGGTRLEGPDVQVKNCVDKRTCISLMGLSVHFCELEPSATLGANDDFLDITRPTSDLEPEDSFAEVQMFYHVNKAYALFRGYGLTDLDEKPLQAIVNMRTPSFANIQASFCQNGAPPAASKLAGFDNAAFMPKNSFASFPAQDSIVFGQGTQADFSYDGDVIYHEFGHAVMGTVTPDLPFVTADERGLDPTTGGMHEAYADYFSAVITGDPDLAEYAGAALGGGAYLRTLTNTKTCPTSLWGEVHQDGEQWAGVLWDIRTALPEDQRAAFDEAVYTAMLGLGANDDQLTAKALTLAEVETTFDAATRTMAEGKFAARGLDDCDERVIDTSKVQAKDVLFIQGPQDVGLTPAPGFLQFKVTAAKDLAKIKVSILGTQTGGANPFGGGSPPAVKLIAKQGAPITWTYNGGTATHDATLTGDVTITSGGNSPAAGEVAGTLAAGDWYLQLVNTGGSTIAQQISFSTEDAPPPATPDAGPGGNEQPGDEEGGCGCEVGGRDAGSPFGPALALLAGLGTMVLVFRRRRG